MEGLRSTLGLPNLPNFNLPPLVTQAAEAGPARTICPASAGTPGDSAMIGFPDSTGGMVGYQWSPTAGLADASSPYTMAYPDTTTWYYLTALDSSMGLPCGLTIDSVLVRVADSTLWAHADAGRDTSVCTLDSVGVGFDFYGKFKCC